jgi:ankyrin repeat protein
VAKADHDGQTALRMASGSCHDVAPQLLHMLPNSHSERRCSWDSIIDAQGKRGGTALHHAIEDPQATRALVLQSSANRHTMVR